jgi:hypothetical protein
VTGAFSDAFAGEVVAPPAALGWTLDEAVALVRMLQPKLHAIKWHVALGGGVLNKGWSTKDIDLYFMPFSNETSKPVVPLLNKLWGKPQPIEKAGYAPDHNYAAKLKFQVGGRRIDAFISNVGGF